MKKAIILFVIFFILDIVLVAVFSNINHGQDYEFMFLPAIFLEIAIYGSFIIYEISKNKGNNNEKKDE